MGCRCDSTQPQPFVARCIQLWHTFIEFGRFDVELVEPTSDYFESISSEGTTGRAYQSSSSSTPDFYSYKTMIVRLLYSEIFFKKLAEKAFFLIVFPFIVFLPIETLNSELALVATEFIKGTLCVKLEMGKHIVGGWSAGTIMLL